MPSSCLCCQKPLSAEGRYHPRCLRRLLGTARLPAIPFGSADMPGLVAEAQGRMSISGVQPKLSVRLNRQSSTLEFVVAGGTHILKPESDRFAEIPRNENLCMNMARELGLRAPPHGLLAMADGKLAYVVKRFDRADDGSKIQKETMFQCLGSTNKYEGSMERIGRAIRSHAAHFGLDTIEFFERVLFCFLTGNGDMHLKNWAFVGQGREIALAPCYDLVCSRLYLSKEADSALTVNGKNNEIQRSDFEALAKRLEIDPKASARVFDKFRRARDPLREMILRSELSPDLRQEVADIFASRCKRLYGEAAG